MAVGGSEQVWEAARGARWRAVLPTALLLALLAAWWLVYRQLNAFALWSVYDLLHFPGKPADLSAVSPDCCGSGELLPGQLDAAVRQGRALAFLLYQFPRTFLLLAAVVFLMGVARSFFSPERTRRLLRGHGAVSGVVLAALLGVVTPFCSCSAVPLFIGFVAAGVPLGATFAFLTAAPLVNEIVLALLWEHPAFGPKIALGYLAIGLVLAVLTGLLIDRLRPQRDVEAWVREMTAGEAETAEAPLTWNDRLRAGLDALRDILARVWPYVLAGVVVGAILHLFVSQDALAALLGHRRWWSVPLAVAVGIPVYASPAGVIPVVDVLLRKGVPLGTVLAFLMAVIGLSLPEMILLRKVLKPRLILLFAAIVAVGALIVGLAFNAGGWR